MMSTCFLSVLACFSQGLKDAYAVGVGSEESLDESSIVRRVLPQIRKDHACSGSNVKLTS